MSGGVVDRANAGFEEDRHDELSDAECNAIYYARARAIARGEQPGNGDGVERDRDLIRWAYRAGAARVGVPREPVAWRRRHGESYWYTTDGPPTERAFTDAKWPWEPLYTSAQVQPVVAWMVGHDAATAATYNAGHRDEAFDAARRWNCSITGLTYVQGAPELPNSADAAGEQPPQERDK